MAGKQQPGNGLWADWILGESGYKDQMDSNLRFLSAAVQLVLDQSTGALPASPSNGMLVATTGSADIQARIDGAWVVVATAKKGWLGFDKALDARVEFDGTAWAVVTSGGGGGGVEEAPADGKTYGRKDESWVEVTGGGGGEGLPDAPVDGKLYGRQDAAWTEISAGTGSGADRYLVASLYAQTTPSNGVSTSSFAMKGTTIIVNTSCKLAALSVRISFEVETARYCVQVYRVNSTTFTVEEVIGTSNEVSGEGLSGEHNMIFNFGQVIGLEQGSKYVIAVVRLDSGASGACRVRSTSGSSDDVTFATVDSSKLVFDQRLSAEAGDTIATISGFIEMGFLYYTDAMILPPSAGQVKAVTAAAYTLGLADSGSYLRFTSAGSSTLTVPSNSSEALPIGTDISVEQGNTGAVSLAADAGVTINVASGFGLKTGGQYGVIHLKKVADDEWTLFGDLEVLV